MLGVHALILWQLSVKTAKADQIAVTVDVLGSLVAYAVWPLTMVLIMIGIATKLPAASAQA